MRAPCNQQSTNGPMGGWMDELTKRLMSCIQCTPCTQLKTCCLSNVFPLSSLLVTINYYYRSNQPTKPMQEGPTPRARQGPSKGLVRPRIHSKESQQKFCGRKISDRLSNKMKTSFLYRISQKPVLLGQCVIERMILIKSS